MKEIITEPVASTSGSSGGDGGGGGGEPGRRATGVRLADGRVYRGKVVISNATR